MRDKGTDRPFSHPLTGETAPGTYLCAGCSAPLFDSDSKFDSHCGWPSFSKPVDGKVGGPPGAAIAETVDSSMGMRRVEVTCSSCGGHIGHVFSGERGPGTLRYCANGTSLKHVPATKK